MIRRCQIFAEHPKAHCTHCHAHSLSLSVKDVIKNTKILRDNMGTAEEKTILIKYSPKRENILGSIKEQLSVSTMVIFMLITCSSCQNTLHSACSMFQEHFE